MSIGKLQNPKVNQLVDTVNALIDQKQDLLTAGTNISIVEVPPSEPTDTRSTATVQTVGNTTWQEVAYCNGKYIAVGNNGYVVISDDGSTWGTPFNVGTVKWRGIAYGNGVYVICGAYGNFAYSTDLTNWTIVTVGNANYEWMAIIYANSKFYSVSTSGNFTSSTDGATWEASVAIDISPNDMLYANGLFIVSGSKGAVKISTDGENWVGKVIGGADYVWDAITYAYGKYIIAGSRGNISYSEDGSTWAKPFTVGTNEWQELVLGNGYIVAVGNNGNTSKSTDGINWETPRTIGQYSWYGLACNGNNYVAVGINSRVTNFEIAPEQAGGTVINCIGKQDTLVSGENIKTINNISLLGSGNIDIQGGSGTPTDVQINGTSITSNNVANIVTNTAYNASSNKIATMSDVPTVNNATLTITQGGTTKGTFTANASSNVTIDLDAGGSAPSNMVTTDTTQNITGEKTFVGEKRVKFKQLTTTSKLGFTLYDNSNNEKGYLEYNPSNKVDNAPLMTLGNYATSASNITQVGFRRYSSVSGANGAYNLLTPLIADAKSPFSLTTTYRNFYMPLGFKNGSTQVTTAKSGVADLSTLFPTIATSVSSSSTNAETVGAKLFYDTVGDIETALNTINSGV